MQVTFKTLDDFFEFLPPDELKIVDKLRRIVLQCIPEAEEHLAYQVPYYKLYKNICFIWPASVTWGKKQTYSGVRFGFTQGYLLQDEIGYLDQGGRKQVYWKDFTDAGQIEEGLLQSYLFEAVMIDQELARGKAGKKRNV